MKLTYTELQEVITRYVVANKISSATLAITKDNIVGLADKIGLIVSFDTSYTDKLGFMDGSSLDFGKTIEEWAIDLTLPQDFDGNGADALAPHYPTFRPTYYSKTLGRKYVATTLPNGNIERGVNDATQLASITASIMKRLYDSEAVFKYNAKRQVLADLITKCESAQTTTNSYNGMQEYVVGTYFFADEGPNDTRRGVVVKPKAVGVDAGNWDSAKAKGYIIELDLVKEIAKPIDTATGEAFVEQIKRDVEVASDLNEGHSLNGNSLGATDGLVLIVKQGLLPTLEVQVEAGAFQAQKVAIPSEVVVVKDFGDADANVFAMLIDSRGVRLHNGYNAIRSQENAKGDFMNYYKHFEYTAFVSRNTFVKVYKSN